jgi:beta-lactamase class A
MLTEAAAIFLAACTSNGVQTSKTVVSGSEKHESFADIEASLGGRIGVFALDTQSGAHLAHRADERFAMCSTFKWVLAAAVLARVDRRELLLDARISFGERDLLDHAPVTRENVAAGSMSIEALAEAAVTVSDNTAANLLLSTIDGPAGLTRFLREIGDDVTRLDRQEPTLNTNQPNDPRDTTSPRAMAIAAKTLLTEDRLSHDSRDRLSAWMKACKTGLGRLRAGVPAGWAAGDKTGTGERGAFNDVAIVWPPERAPIVIASYSSDGDATPKAHDAAHAEIARRIVARLA